MLAKRLISNGMSMAIDGLKDDLEDQLNRLCDNMGADNPHAEAEAFWLSSAISHADGAMQALETVAQALYKAEKRELVGVPSSYAHQLTALGFTEITDDVPLSADRGWERTRAHDNLEQVVLERIDGETSTFEIHCLLEDYWQAQAVVYSMDTALEICDTLSRPLR